MLTDSEFVKIRVAVPLSAADKVRSALASSGAGVMGKYDSTSASIRQTGRFRPLPGAHPSIGEVGKIEEVEEELIEALCHRDLADQVIASVRAVHPYEEPAIDILPRLEIK